MDICPIKKTKAIHGINGPGMYAAIAYAPAELIKSVRIPDHRSKSPTR